MSVEKHAATEFGLGTKPFRSAAPALRSDSRASIFAWNAYTARFQGISYSLYTMCPNASSEEVTL